LKSNVKIAHIQLDENNLRVEGGKALAKCLKNKDSLITLGKNKNLIGK